MMGRSLVWLALMVLAGCQAPGGSGSLEGRLVFNLPPGLPELPLDDYAVLLDGPELVSATTNDDGTFVFTDLTAGDYILRPDPTLSIHETQVQVSVEVESGLLTSAPDLRVTPAGVVRGTVSIAGGGSPEGFRCQLLSTGLAAVTTADGSFVINRVPAKLEGGYELLVERADVGAARRAGIVVEPFKPADVGNIEVVYGGSGTANTHPAFVHDRITFINNGTPLTASTVPLPYRLPNGFARRFDRVALEAPAEDPDGDPLAYEWSASAGTLFDALTPEPLWQPDAYAGSQATLTVTVRDGHGGIARMSTDIAIADVFAGTAHRVGDEVVHSYRVEGGPWQVDVVTLGRIEGEDELGEPIIVPDQVKAVVSLTQDTDPRPLLFAQHVVARKGGELVRYPRSGGTPQPWGLRPSLDSVAIPATAATTDLAWVVEENSSTLVQSRVVATGTAGPSFSCGGTCLGLASNGDVVAALGTSGKFFLSNGTTAPAPGTTNALVGRAFSHHGSSLAFVEGGAGASSARQKLLVMGPTGNPTQAYEGYYEMMVWAHAGPDVLITEQEYRSLRHPPFLRWVRLGQGWMGDSPWRAEGWMADRAYDWQDGVALARRVTRADWPEPFDRSRSEIVRVRVEESFTEEVVP